MQYRIGAKMAPEAELSMAVLKRELSASVAEERHLQNVDCAKKRAVSQAMDYDNFRQLVLGADLKPMTPQELRNFQPEAGRKEHRDVSSLKKENGTDESAPSKQGFSNYAEFKRQSLCSKTFESAFEIAREIGALPDINKIVGVDFDPSLYLSQLRLITQKPGLAPEEHAHILRSLQQISQSKYFQAVFKTMLSRPETLFLKRILQNAQSADEELANSVYKAFF